MKKILLATSALVMVAGAAAAEVAVSGSARMGLIYDGEDTYMTSRVRVVFSMSGETDTGLSFGASVRNDQIGNGNNTGYPTGTANGDSTVYISGAFGKLTFGDVDSAANALVGHVSGVGLTGLDDLNELRYLGHEKTAALYEYSAGDLTFGLSAGQINDTDGVAGNDDAYSVAVKYAPGAYSVALGYETAGDIDHLALGASATFGAATVKFVASDTDVAGDPTQYALSLDYVTGATTLTVFATDEGDINNYGIGAAYDLGGGAKVVGGIVRDDAASATLADVGLSFSF
jgi:outer membrane protein OmpU